MIWDAIRGVYALVLFHTTDLDFSIAVSGSVTHVVVAWRGRNRRVMDPARARIELTEVKICSVKGH
jgi:hypothetical protein